MENHVESRRHLSPVPVTAGAILGLCTLVLWGCPVPDFESEEGQMTFQTPGLNVGGSGGFSNQVGVLEGTPICAQCTEAHVTLDEGSEVELSCGDGGEYDALACFDQDVEAGHLDGAGCVNGEGPGTATWTFTPTDCPLIDLGAELVPDQVEFRFVDLEAVEGEFDQWLEEAATEMFEAGLLAQPDGSGFDESLRNPDGDPFRVVADEPFVFRIRLVEGDTGQPVAWTAQEGVVDVATTAGEAVSVIEIGIGSAELSLPEGSEAEITLTVGGRAWSAGRVIAVAPSAVRELDLVAAVYADGQDGAGTPYAARAVLRDDEGRPVYGAPVSWKVTGGELAMAESSLDLPGADYVELADACIDPADTSPRSMTLKASYRGHSDRVQLSWDPVDPEETPDSEGWAPHESCTGGCSCRADGPSATPAALAGVLGCLGALIRRRIR